MNISAKNAVVAKRGTKIKSRSAAPRILVRVKPSLGVPCPRCGSRMLLCLYTRHQYGATVRRKQCTKCGRGVLTREMAL